VSIAFDQPSYTVNEDNGKIELVLGLSSPLGCNCSVSVMIRIDEMTAKGKQCIL